MQPAQCSFGLQTCLLLHNLSHFHRRVIFPAAKPLINQVKWKFANFIYETLFPSLSLQRVGVLGEKMETKTLKCFSQVRTLFSWASRGCSRALASSRFFCRKSNNVCVPHFLLQRKKANVTVSHQNESDDCARKFRPRSLSDVCFEMTAALGLFCHQKVSR